MCYDGDSENVLLPATMHLYVVLQRTMLVDTETRQPLERKPSFEGVIPVQLHLHTVRYSVWAIPAPNGFSFAQTHANLLDVSSAWTPAISKLVSGKAANHTNQPPEELFLSLKASKPEAFDRHLMSVSKASTGSVMQQSKAR